MKQEMVCGYAVFICHCGFKYETPGDIKATVNMIFDHDCSAPQQDKGKTKEDNHE